MSNSSEFVLCAISKSPLGVDIEKIRPIDIDMIKRVCNKDELEYVLDDNSHKRFFEIWTFKEAYFKCIGTGIMDFTSIDYFDSRKKKQKIFCDEYVAHIIYGESSREKRNSRHYRK